MDTEDLLVIGGLVLLAMHHGSGSGGSGGSDQPPMVTSKTTTTAVTNQATNVGSTVTELANDSKIVATDAVDIFKAFQSLGDDGYTYES